MRIGARTARVGFVVAGLTLAIVIGEGAARLAWRPPPLRDPRLDIHPRYTVNGAGIRGPEYERDAPPGVVRVVVLGDSFTYGIFVEDHEAYPRVLEAAVNRSGRTRFEIVNLGQAGANLPQLLGRLVRLGLPLHPAAVIYGCTWNDIEGLGYRRSFVPRVRGIASPFYLLRVLWPRVDALREMLAPPHGSYAYEVLDNYLDNPAAWERFEASLDRLAELGREQGIPIVVFVHTSIDYLNAWHPLLPVYARIAAAAAARGLPVIESFETFRGRDAEPLRVPNDHHPNANGHALLAEALRAGLAALPASVWPPPARPASGR